MVVAFQVIHQANRKAVFAHFMVTNSENYTASDWQSDVGLAQDAYINMFTPMLQCRKYLRGCSLWSILYFSQLKRSGMIGYLAEGKDANYKGLCSFAYNYSYYPSGMCDTTEHPMPVLIVLDFLPLACVAGTGPGPVSGLCLYACIYGYCPINLCSGTQTGALVQLPAQTEGPAEGYCPPGTCILEAEQEITEVIATSGYNISDFADFNLTILATALISEDGCTVLQKKQIRLGWVESWNIMNYMYKVAKAGINFNEAAAVEYLGPPSMNQDQWSNYKAIYLNLATIQPSWKILDLLKWFAWKIAYFSLQILKDAMYWADTMHTPREYADLNNHYNNQALVWIHELLHLNWVLIALSSSNIHHVTDIKVGYEEGEDCIMTYYTAYRPWMCKALARLGWSTGLWTIQNADSLTLYAFAKLSIQLVIVGWPDAYNHSHSGNGGRNRTWTMSIYSEVNCTGDYYVVEGKSLVMADLGTSDKSTSASCKYYTAGSDRYTSCDQSTLTEPLSWQLPHI
ncbi:uncharacterized protein P174DRAFT_432208 [Aspergillus novofumigatus IBT 16806]|uniref:Secreted LysM effector LysM C-terminal domain-containing protein n=1 Tax=Aspergillus novofumigatus (strain IBT 16806) TaxID=1392255 RepID=A0A2I1C5F2_ASPN1|nr:uncharacterized protein P174DRAFT_432208 [Aspergillus novofumigatus IBT 16806]PKX92837.1 hypothetical protein P174DRAFT_432208 [Aspergillus novofumigatus IBT 16806]